MPQIFAFSCVSSNYRTVCMRNRICYKLRASRQCEKFCDTLDCLSFYMRNCTDCVQRVFHQYAASCESSDYQHGCMNSCTDHSWNASPLNVLTYAVWGKPLLKRKWYTGCNEIFSLLNDWACAFWDCLLLCRRSHTVCNDKAFHLNGFACGV